MSIVTVLAIVITVLTCLHITYTVTYTPIKNKITGAKQKALETQKKQDAINQAVLKMLAANEQQKTI